MSAGLGGAASAFAKRFCGTAKAEATAPVAARNPRLLKVLRIFSQHSANHPGALSKTSASSTLNRWDQISRIPPGFPASKSLKNRFGVVYVGQNQRKLPQTLEKLAKLAVVGRIAEIYLL